jgi:hypothetical protein
MFLATANKAKQLLHVSYIGQVLPEELERGLEDLKVLLAELSPGFRVLVDFERLEFMGIDCVPPVGRGMELIGQGGVGLVVRVVPDPSKDIGLSILTVFHYTPRPRIAYCKSLLEAAQILSL